MKEPISIKEIFAIVVKQGKAILCIALVFAILVGSFQFVQKYKDYTNTDNSMESVEKRYQKAQDKYDKKVAPIKEEIALVKKYIATQQEYLDNSIWMQLDPAHKYTASMVYGIMAVDVNDPSNYYVTEGAVSNFVESKVQSQVLILWDTVDMNKLFKEELDIDLNQKYWRELFTFDATTNGDVTFDVLGRTEEEAALFAGVFEAYMLENLDALTDDMYAYKFVKLSESVRVSIDQGLAEKQHAAVKKINTYNDTLTSLQNTLNKVSVPKKASLIGMKDVVVETAVWFVLGGVIGLLLACVFAWVKYILSEGIETSKQMSAIVNAPYLGTAVHSKTFKLWADMLVGEPYWKDAETAKNYISEYIKTTADADDILVLSTRKLDQTDANVKVALDAANNNGRKVCYINEAKINPQVLVALRDSKKVVMAERAGVSSKLDVQAVVELVKQNDAQIVGFVFV